MPGVIMPQSGPCLNPFERLRASFALLEHAIADFRSSFDTLDLPPFYEIEATLIDLVRRISCDAHAAVLEPYSLDADAITYQDARWVKCRKRSPVRYHCLDGVMEMTTQLYHHEHDPQRLLNPQARRAGLLLDKYTYQAGQALLKSAADDTYRGAASMFDIAHILGVKHTQLHRDLVTIQSDVAPVFDECVAQGMEALELPEEAQSICVMLDRVSVAMEEPKARPVGRPKKGAAKRPVARQWRMAYIGALSWHDAQGESLGSVRLAELPEQGEVFVQTMQRALAKLMAYTPRRLKLVTLGDGAEEIQNKLREVTRGFDVDMRLTDYWHTVEYLMPALKECVPDDTASWMKLLKDGLLHGKNGASTVLRHLRNMKEEHEGKPREATRDAITYMENHLELMNYALAREQGLPVGSGVVEASCKTVVEVRMKRSGMRWKQPGARGVMRLRAMSTSAAPFWAAAYHRIALFYSDNLTLL